MTRMFYLGTNGLNIAVVPLSNKQANKYERSIIAFISEIVFFPTVELGLSLVVDRQHSYYVTGCILHFRLWLG